MLCKSFSLIVQFSLTRGYFSRSNFKTYILIKLDLYLDLKMMVTILMAMMMRMACWVSLLDSAICFCVSHNLHSHYLLVFTDFIILSFSHDATACLFYFLFIPIYSYATFTFFLLFYFTATLKVI